MLRAASVITPPFKADAVVTLDEVDRHRRRLRFKTQCGLDVLLDLNHAVMLNHGEGLVLDDGRIIEVRARPEALLKVTGRNERHLLQLAWQLGNRHLPAQIYPDHIRIRRDHVIAEMLGGLGATLTPIEAVFTPETGAYRHTHSG